MCMWRKCAPLDNVDIVVCILFVLVNLAFMLNNPDLYKCLWVLVN